MKSLVIYDSNYGNTQRVAEVIADEIGAKVASVSSIQADELKNLELLIVGTPINGWKPTAKMQEFLSELETGQLDGVKAASFDTRVKLFIHGDAMGKVADSLRSAGADIFVDPMAFYVTGPQASPMLLNGEIEKAKKWAREIKSKLS